MSVGHLVRYFQKLGNGQLISNNIPRLYVSKQLGHSKATTILDHYAKWLPSAEERFVNVLDTPLEKVGTKLA